MLKSCPVIDRHPSEEQSDSCLQNEFQSCSFITLEMPSALHCGILGPVLGDLTGHTSMAECHSHVCRVSLLIG